MGAFLATQTVRCVNCGGSGLLSIVGLLVAGLAFGVSFYSLYVGALRRPVVQVDSVEQPWGLMFPGWSGPYATDPRLHLRLVVANTGASGTYMHRLQLAGDFKVRGSASPFGRFNPLPNVWEAGKPSGAPNVVLPVVLERGDIRTYELRGTFTLAKAVQENPLELATRLRAMGWVEFEVVWTYQRPSRRLFSTRSEPHKETLVVQVDAHWLRQGAIDHWASNDAYSEFREILVTT
jgi:hypothetical protein